MRFNNTDWAVLGVYVAASLAVGLVAPHIGSLWRVCCSRRLRRALPQQQPNTYYLGEAAAHPCVVAISLVSGLTSGISFLGSPAYTYANGAGIMYGIIGYVASVPVVAFIFIPFFARIGADFAGDSQMSAFAYLERRFSPLVRWLCAALFVMRVALYLAVVLLAPARAIEAVSSLPMTATILTCGVAATIYTVLGGMAAVIYTDLMQSITLMTAIVVAIAIACSALPPSLLWSGDAASTLWRWNLTVGGTHLEVAALEPGAARSVPWYVLGTFFQAVGQTGCDQISVQRFLSLRGGVARAQLSAFATGVLNVMTSLGLSFLGIAIYAYVQRNLGGAAPQLASNDELLPWFFLHELPPGASGALSAAILGCTMSVFAGGLNSAATVTVVDLVRDAVAWPMPPTTPTPLAVKRRCRDDAEGGVDSEEESCNEREEEYGGSEYERSLVDVVAVAAPSPPPPGRTLACFRPLRTPAWCSRARAAKVLTSMYGVVATLMALWAAQSHSSLVELSIAALGMTTGPVLGVFVLGLFSKWTGRRAGEFALCGGLLTMVAFAVVNVVRPESINTWLLCPLLTTITVACGAVASLCACGRRSSGGGEELDRRLLFLGGGKVKLET